MARKYSSYQLVYSQYEQLSTDILCNNDELIDFSTSFAAISTM